MQSDIVSAARWFGFCLIAASLILALGINLAVLQNGAQTNTVRLDVEKLPQVWLNSNPTRGAEPVTLRVQFTDNTPKK